MKPDYFTECECCSNNHINSGDKSNQNSEKDKSVTSTKASRGEHCSGSLELYLSPDSEDSTYMLGETRGGGAELLKTSEIEEESPSQETNLPTYEAQSFSTERNFDEDNQGTTSSGPLHYQCSPDMFGNSQEFSQDMFQESPVRRTPTYTDLTATCSEEKLTDTDCREHVEEWSSQELMEISEDLKMRSKQVKRLILAVIRKRQMEDETLSAFKKRLKKL